MFFSFDYIIIYFSNSIDPFNSNPLRGAKIDKIFKSTNFIKRKKYCNWYPEL